MTSSGRFKINYVDPDHTICEKCQRSYYVTENMHNRMYHMNKVMDHLYIGGSGSSACLAELKYENIDYIINVTAELRNSFPNDFKYNKFEWEDCHLFKIVNDLDVIADDINRQISMGMNVLVHCYSGMSRSASAIIAYLIKYQNMNVETGINVLKKVRPIACPNQGFINQLKIFQKKYV